VNIQMFLGLLTLATTRGTAYQRLTSGLTTRLSSSSPVAATTLELSPPLTATRASAGHAGPLEHVAVEADALNRPAAEVLAQPLEARTAQASAGALSGSGTTSR
jgi:hypothetical protein